MQPTPSAPDLNLSLRRNIYEKNGKDATPAGLSADDEGIGAGETSKGSKDLEDKLAEPEKPVHCHSCGTDCTKERWHRVKTAPESAQGKTGATHKFDLCPTCYVDGRFPETSQASEYVKLENASYSALPDKDRPWDDREELLLLEGLEAFDQDWDSVAEHVGTRSREQCIMKFIQLPIEDAYVAAETADAEDEKQPAREDLRYLSGGRMPFSQADNPVMSVLAFLAGGVDPTVAAAASGQAVDAMVQSMHSKQQTLRQRFEDLNNMNNSNNTTTTTINSSSQPPKDPSDSAAPQPPADKPPKPEHPESDIMDLDRPSTSTHGTPSQKPNDAPTTVLALSAARSTALSTHTERRIASLLSTATSLQLSKLELKLEQFAEMEALLAAERREVERRSRELFLERLAFRRRCEEVAQDVRRGVGMGLEGEGLRVITEALGRVGVKGGLGLENSGKGGGRGRGMMGDGVGLGENGVGAGEWGQDGINGGGAADAGGIEEDELFKPLGPEDAGFKSWEI